MNKSPENSPQRLNRLVATLAAELLACLLLIYGVGLSDTVYALIVTAIVVVTGWKGIRVFKKLAQHRFRFSLANFLLTCTILAVGLGVVTLHLSRIRAQASVVREMSLDPKIRGKFRIEFAQSWMVDFLKVPSFSQTYFQRVDRVVANSEVSASDVKLVAEYLRRLPHEFGIRLSIEPGDGDRALEHLGNLVQLRRLTVGGIVVRKQDILPLGIGLTDAGLSHVANLRLTHLSLRGTEVTNLGLSRLAHPEKLQSLTLDYSLVDDANGQVYKRFSNLQSLSAQGTRLSDSAVANISQLINLRELYLNKTSATDSSVVELDKLHELTYLGLAGLPLQPETIEELRASLPNCEIFWQ